MHFSTNNHDGSSLIVTTNTLGQVLLKVWDREAETITIITPTLARNIATALIERADEAERIAK